MEETISYEKAVDIFERFAKYQRLCPDVEEIELKTDENGKPYIYIKLNKFRHFEPSINGLPIKTDVTYTDKTNINNDIETHIIQIGDKILTEIVINDNNEVDKTVKVKKSIIEFFYKKIVALPVFAYRMIRYCIVLNREITKLNKYISTIKKYVLNKNIKITNKTFLDVVGHHIDNGPKDEARWLSSAMLRVESQYIYINTLFNQEVDGMNYLGKHGYAYTKLYNKIISFLFIWIIKNYKKYYVPLILRTTIKS